MYRKTRLDNGVRLVTEQTPSRLVSVGIWVAVGSRDEHDLNNGCAHFVEHMLFKGTGRRSAWQIARELDALGGTANAFTTSETTCLYATVLDEQLPRLVELLTDLFLHSAFAPAEVEREREVILQEIGMVEDTPDDQVHDLFATALWEGHPLGRTVLGSREVVAALDAHHLLNHVRRFYTADRIVVAAAGNLDHERFCDLWQESFSRIPRGVAHDRRQPLRTPPRRRIYFKPLEQVHMVLGVVGLPVTAPQRYALLLANILLGGNMSSRLFQEIREQRGLAYSVYSYLAAHSDSGMLAIYLGVEPESVEESLRLVAREIDRLKEQAVSEEELAGAREYAKASVFLAAENMENRMTRLAKNELFFGRELPFEELVAGIEAVRSADIQRLSGELFREPLTGVILGPLVPGSVDWNVLNGAGG